MYKTAMIVIKIGFSYFIEIMVKHNHCYWTRYVDPLKVINIDSLAYRPDKYTIINIVPSVIFYALVSITSVQM